MASMKFLDDGTSSGVGGVLFTERRKFNLDENSYSELWPSATPFLTGLLNGATQYSNLSDPMYKMFEHRNPMEKQQFTIASVGGAIPNSDSSQSVVLTGTSVVGLPTTSDHVETTDAWWKWGQSFEVWDSTRTTRRGVFAVIAVASQDTLTVKNLGTTAFTPVAGDIATYLGPLSEVGALAPDAWHDELKVIWNACGHMRTSVEIAGDLYYASLRGANNELERLRQQKLLQHKISVERLLMRGDSVLGTNMDSAGTFADNWRTGANSKKIRSTMGIITAILKYGNTSGDYQNIFDFTAGMEFNDWVDACEKMFQYTEWAGQKDFYCGPRAMSYWTKINAGKLRSGFEIQLSDFRTDRIGLNFKYIETPFGVARLIPVPSMKRDYSNVMISVTRENIGHATYRSPAYFTNIKTEDRFDGVKDEWESDEGAVLKLIESHSYVKLPVA